MKERTIIYISDGTAITTESLGNSLLSQFPNFEFKHKIYPYIDNLDKADRLLEEIKATQWEEPPILFTSLVNESIRNIFTASQFTCFDLFASFIPKLSKCLGTPPSPAIHKMHSISDPARYAHRIEAVNFSLNCDDGLGLKHYPNAEVILIGVSRSGKTPTCLYLALNFGILAANYPFTEEDFSSYQLPKALQNHKEKLFGLAISPERLCQIRHSRRANSQYALLEQCQKEVKFIHELYDSLQIPWLDTTHRSVEEIATLIISKMDLKRQ